MISAFTSTIADGNMSYKFGTRKEVDENHERFFKKHHIDPAQVVSMGQVHGDQIEIIAKPDHYPATDGIITANLKLWLSIYHADCIPLFFTGRTSQVAGRKLIIGATHVGWRGVVAKLPQKMGKKMGKPKDIKVSFGPFICKDHYDVPVDDERLKLLPHKIKGGKAYVDLYQAIKGQLIEVGVPDSGIMNYELCECTAEHPKKYWSYHKDREKLGGIMLSVIRYID